MNFSNKVRDELIKLKMWETKNKNQERQISVLIVREAFIKSGFLNDPNKEYHLEITFKNNNKANEVKEILKNFNIISKDIKKRKKTMVYIKEGEEISKFLALIGANESVISFEEIRVLKETRNNINRLVNCETANLNKTIIASVLQNEDIKLLKKYNKFENLSEDLKETAKIRIKYQNDSYEELGKKLKKPIGKSGVKHRLKKLSNIAKELRGIK